MDLKHSFEKKGILFFRYRGQIPLVLFVVAAPAIYLSPTQHFWVRGWYPIILLSGCVLLSFSGFWIRFLAIGRSAKQTSGRNTWGHEAKNLNTSGMYSIVRNPLYLGNFLIWMGIVVFTANVWFMLLVILAFWLYYERIIFSEEAFLEREFGNDFLEWSKRVPVFIPSMKNYEKPSIAFSLKTILRREYPGVSATIMGFVYVEFIRFWVLTGSPQWLWRHGIVVLVALLLSLILRTLKHHTNILKEEDRS